MLMCYYLNTSVDKLKFVLNFHVLEVVQVLVSFTS